MDTGTLGLPAVAGTSLAQGRFLNAATANQPVAVLGAVTARLLGIDRIRPGMRIWAGGQWYRTRNGAGKPVTGLRHSLAGLASGYCLARVVSACSLSGSLEGDR